MKFRHKAPPKEGDIRSVTKFLILPLTIEMETRWLERATYTEKYLVVLVFEDGVPMATYMWMPIYWGNPRCSHGHQAWDECPDCGH